MDNGQWTMDNGQWTANGPQMDNGPHARTTHTHAPHSDLVD